MRLPVLILLLACSVPAFADQMKDFKQALACGEIKSSAECGVSRADLEQARDDFARGLKLRKQGRTEEALAAFKAASSLVPRDVEYASAREIVRQQLVLQYIQQGNALLREKRNIQAAAAYRQALEIDPANPFAQERLQQALPQPPVPAEPMRVFENSTPVEARPAPVKKSFHFQGDSRTLLQQVAASFGLHATLADSVQSRQVRLDIEAVDFATAMQAAGGITRTFWVPLTSQEILVAADTREQHDQYDRMVMRTFYLPETTAAAQLTEVVNALRTIFDIRYVVPQPANNSVAVRAPRAVMEAATRFLDSISEGRPQVMLQMEVYQVSRMLIRALGLNMPLQWQTFNVGQQALSLLQQPSVQDLINQLIASGGINQANSTALSALLAQVQSQQNSLLSQPFATFGGGTTLTALRVPPASANFSRTESYVHLLDRLTLRAGQGEPATMRIGSRFPILNATFAPIFNSGALSQVIQGGSFTAPFPSFNYEDLGITVKATPQIHADKVTLALEVEIKSLSSQSFNGIPVISNRSYVGAVEVQNGEAGVVAGTLDHQEQDSVTAPIGLASIPGLNNLVSTRNTQVTDTELLVVITPHIVALPPQTRQAVVIPTLP